MVVVELTHACRPSSPYHGPALENDRRCPWTSSEPRGRVGTCSCAVLRVPHAGVSLPPLPLVLPLQEEQPPVVQACSGLCAPMASGGAPSAGRLSVPSAAAAEVLRRLAPAKVSEGQHLLMGWLQRTHPVGPTCLAAQVSVPLHCMMDSVVDCLQDC